VSKEKGRNYFRWGEKIAISGGEGTKSRNYLKGRKKPSLQKSQEEVQIHVLSSSPQDPSIRKKSMSVGRGTLKKEKVSWEKTSHRIFGEKKENAE